MSKRWLSILLSLSAASLLFTACKKNMSSDAPLPATYYPSVIIGSDNGPIYAIDPNTGKKNWECSQPGFPSSFFPFKPSPVLYNSTIFMANSGTDTIYKIDSRTGSVRKKMIVTIPNPSGGSPLVAPPFTVVATPILDGKLLYLATTSGAFYAIDTGTGLATWNFVAGGPIYSSPTIYNGNVYFGTTTGQVYCINKTVGPDPVTGQPIWAYPGANTLSPGLNPSFTSSPSICPPFLYIGSTGDSSMYCMYLNPSPDYLLAYPNSDTLRWTYKTGGSIISSPATFGGVCVFGSNDFNVYCLDTQTHSPRWTFHTSSQVNSSPFIDNQTVYIGSYDYFLYSINIVNGSMKWKFKSTGLIKSSPLPYQGTIFIGSYDGKLYAIDSSQGQVKWSYPVIGNIESSPVIEDYSGKQYNSGISGFTN